MRKNNKLKLELVFYPKHSPLELVNDYLLLFFNFIN